MRSFECLAGCFKFGCSEYLPSNKLVKSVEELIDIEANQSKKGDRLPLKTKIRRLDGCIILSMFRQTHEMRTWKHIRQSAELKYSHINLPGSY